MFFQKDININEIPFFIIDMQRSEEHVASFSDPCEPQDTKQADNLWKDGASSHLRFHEHSFVISHCFL